MGRQELSMGPLMGWRFWWHYYTFPIRRSGWRLRGWLTEAQSIEDMIEQGKIVVLVDRADPNIKQYILKMEPTRRERILWDDFRSTVGEA